MAERRLAVIPKVGSVPLPRGPLMDAETVASELFGGLVSPRWVRQNVTPKVRLGQRTVGFYRDDVLAFIERRKEAAA